jgi:hypothetical protein
MPKVSLSITPSGDVKIQIEGMKGKKCVDLSQAFEDALGKIVNKRFTSEYYQEEYIKKRDYLKVKK